MMQKDKKQFTAQVLEYYDGNAALEKKHFGRCEEKIATTTKTVTAVERGRSRRTISYDLLTYSRR